MPDSSAAQGREKALREWCAGADYDPDDREAPHIEAFEAGFDYGSRRRGQDAAVFSGGEPRPAPSAATVDQLELVPVPRCDYCGPTGWTIERWGRETHKCRCPERTDPYCQAHPNGDCALPKPRWNPKWPLTSLYGTTWEDAFACPTEDVDESAGLKDTA